MFISAKKAIIFVFSIYVEEKRSDISRQIENFVKYLVNKNQTRAKRNKKNQLKKKKTHVLRMIRSMSCV